jgi:hypothetical protein
MKTETGRTTTLRAAYDRAFETFCYARRELDSRNAANADRETLRCFEGIVASAQREYVRARNAFAMRLLEGRGGEVPESWRPPVARAHVACESRFCCAV